MNLVRLCLRFPRLSLAGFAAAAFIAACAAGSADPVEKPAPPAAAAVHRPVGAAGCAAANCHGRPDAPSLTGEVPPDGWRSSFTHWRAADPHGNAHALLERSLAKEMIRQLKKGDPTYKEATEEPRCLACHTNPSLAGEAPFGLPADVTARLRGEGIGCEGCHGNAEAWQFRHTGWVPHGKRPADFARYGMVPFDDLGERALACAGCHVGAAADPGRGYPVRDMNHDMIAAGHPRLNFDYRTYARIIRPHWYDPPGPPGSAAREWLIGRVAAAEALAKLHAARAPGVELSEYNCFACHHDLTPVNWRGKTEKYYAGRKPGDLAWQLPWPVGKAGVLTDAERKTVSEFAAKAWQSDAKPATEAVAAARLRLVQGGPIPPVEFLAMVRVDDAGLRTFDWDQACALYAALGAAEADLVAAGSRPDVAAEFDALARALYLPGHRPAGEKRIDSPALYAPEKVRGAFLRLQDKLRAAAGP